LVDLTRNKGTRGFPELPFNLKDITKSGGFVEIF
jgi:hypothetical protein